MKRLAFMLGSLLVFFAIAEFVYRLATAPSAGAPDGSDQEWRERYTRMNETIYRASTDPRLVYEPVAGASVEMEYGLAGFNAQGMRESADVPVAPGDDARVAVVGDSLVWTEFLSVEQALPRQIDTALGAGWEALNFGVSGYDTADEMAWYETHVRRYSPDVVVVVFCMNDMMIMSGPFERFADPAARARKNEQEELIDRLAPVRRETIDELVHHREKYATIKLWARFQGILMRRDFDADYDDEYLVMWRQPSARERLSASFGELGRSIGERGATPILVISPVLESFDDYHWGAIHEFVREEAEGAGFAVHDPLPEWRDTRSPESLRISGDNLHYGEDGTRVFAESIAAFVREQPVPTRQGGAGE